MDRDDRREDIVSAAHQVDSSPGANWVFQGRQVGAPSLGAWPKQNPAAQAKACAQLEFESTVDPFPAGSTSMVRPSIEVQP
jgi:hypothetical protein